MTDDPAAPAPPTDTEPTQATTTPGGQPEADADQPAPADLDAIERQLADTEAALGRLDDGSYWRDEVTGEEIPDAVHAADPLARRAAP